MPPFKKYKLNEIAIVLNNKRIPLNSRERAERKGKYPYYGASGIVDYVNDFLFEGEHVLISEDGENLKSRQTPIAFKANGKFWVNNHAHIVKGKEPYINDWLVYFFSLFDLTPYITGAVQPKLSMGNLLSIPIDFPQETENAKRIVSILRSLDDKIELNRRTNHTLEQIAQTLFKKFGEAGGLVELNEVIELNPKLSLKKGQTATYVEMSNLPESEFSIRGNEQKEFNGGSKFQNGDTLFARITPCLENGKTGFVDFLKENEVAFGSTEFIVMRAKNNISKYYPYFIARDNLFRDYAIRSMVGTSGRQRVQTEMLLSFEVPQWDTLQMKEFDISVASIFKKIKSNSDESLMLSNIRDSLLPKLMSGEIEVNGAVKMSEAELAG